MEGAAPEFLSPIDFWIDKFFGVVRYLSDEEAERECPDVLREKRRMKREEGKGKFYVVEMENGRFSVIRRMEVVCYD